jgi:CheY-like chemotaxis protein
LGIILLVADTLLLRGASKTPKLREPIESIKSAARSAALLTRQLLMFGRKQKSEPRPIDLSKVLLEMKGILKNALGEDIRFQVKLGQSSQKGKKLWPVYADPAQIEQLLTNLCFNARDAMPTGGKLSIVLRNTTIKGSSHVWRMGKPMGDFVELLVADTGVGISAEHLERVFEPFFTTKQDGRSTGLGLATVYGTVQEAQGDIAVESTPGQGTTFRICFPRLKGNSERKSAPKPPTRAIHRGKETILLVEDEPTLRSVTATLLRERGYKVFEARDAKTALAAWKKAEKKIDLVISDIVLPQSSGLELIQKFDKTRTRPIRALFVSAYSDKKLSDYSFDQTRSDFIEKPYTADELLSKIRHVLTS